MKNKNCVIINGIKHELGSERMHMDCRCLPYYMIGESGEKIPKKLNDERVGALDKSFKERFIKNTKENELGELNPIIKYSPGVALRDNSIHFVTKGVNLLEERENIMFDTSKECEVFIEYLKTRLYRSEETVLNLFDYMDKCYKEYKEMNK